jgi:hypothetical protein
MNTFITITDLFGSTNITPKTEAILIYSNEIHKLLKRLTKDNIWGYRFDVIDEILRNHNLDPKRYVTMGDIYMDKKLDKILLWNREATIMSDDYLLISKRQHGSLWQPISTKSTDYVGFGYVYSSANKIKPDFSVGLIHKKYIVHPNVIINSSLVSNEFGFMSVGSSVKHLLMSKFYKNSENFKLFNSDNKYITKFKDNTLGLGDKITGHKQNISYNAQGELVIDGECVTSPSTEESVYMESCSAKDSQKWSIIKDKVVSKASDKCIDPSKLQMKKCTETESWYTEDGDQHDGCTDSHYNSWDKYKGDTIVLTEAETPWYIARQAVVPPSLTPSPFQDDRFAEDDIEHFTQDNNSYMFIIICLIAFIIYFYYFCYRKY